MFKSCIGGSNRSEVKVKKKKEENISGRTEQDSLKVWRTCE